MKDELGDRMKRYEDVTRLTLSPRNYNIIRIDGKAFHTYTKGLERPFDQKLIHDMDETAIYLCQHVQGAKMAFVQSDEISILMTDFENINSQCWFGGDIRKICSISASIATAKFNELRPGKLATFDSRVSSINDKTEVENYFIWRQQDTVRNSISSVAQSMYSPKQLHGMNTDAMQELIFQKGINWNDYHSHLKRGRLILKVQYAKNDAIRNKWIVAPETPHFTKQRLYLSILIPDK